MRVTIEGADEYIGGLSVLVDNISNRIFKWAKDDAEYLKTLMQEKILLFEDTGTLRRSLIVTSYKSNNNSSVKLFTLCPYAKANEFGVKPHWISVYDKPEVQEWIDRKYKYDKDILNPGYLFIGGPKSRIKKGESKNKFFFNTMDEYIRSKRYESKTREAMKEVLHETFK